MLRKIITWAVVLFLVVWLWTQPHGAHDAINSLLGALKNAGNGLASFANWL